MSLCHDRIRGLMPTTFANVGHITNLNLVIRRLIQDLIVAAVNDGLRAFRKVDDLLYDVGKQSEETRAFDCLRQFALLSRRDSGDATRDNLSSF